MRAILVLFVLSAGAGSAVCGDAEDLAIRRETNLGGTIKRSKESAAGRVIEVDLSSAESLAPSDFKSKIATTIASKSYS
jgi:hypothetical protein